MLRPGWDLPLVRKQCDPRITGVGPMLSAKVTCVSASPLELISSGAMLAAAPRTESLAAASSTHKPTSRPGLRRNDGRARQSK
jgi:hypothetical protein